MNIEGITQITGPRNLSQIRGHLQLPSGFPEKQFACKWTKVGAAVERDSEPEMIAGTSDIQADGWKVWRDPKTKKPCERALGNGKYILMVRPRALQTALQKIYGNMSKDRMEAEYRGETVAGEPVQDSGIFGYDALKRIPGLGSEEANVLKVPRNPVGPLAEETSIKAQSRKKVTLKE